MAFIPQPFTFNRTNRQPLDEYEVFNSLSELDAYIATGARYVGQVVAVRGAGNTPAIFIINEDFTYSPIEGVGGGSGDVTQTDLLTAVNTHNNDATAHASIRDDINNAAGDITALQGKISGIESDLGAAQTAIADADNIITENRDDIVDLQTQVNEVNDRVDSLENLGHYLGAVNTQSDLPANSGDIPVTATLNDFMTVRNDSTQGGAARYVITNIAADGAITWAFDIAYSTDISGKADIVPGAAAGNLAGLDAQGNLTDSGKAASDFVGVTGDQNIGGEKTFTDKILIGNGASVDMRNQILEGLRDPSQANDAVNKEYVDENFVDRFNPQTINGNKTFDGNVSFSEGFKTHNTTMFYSPAEFYNNAIVTQTPTSPTHAANKAYVDSVAGGQLTHAGRSFTDADILAYPTIQHFFDAEINNRTFRSGVVVNITQDHSNPSALSTLLYGVDIVNVNFTGAWLGLTIILQSNAMASYSNVNLSNISRLNITRNSNHTTRISSNLTINNVNELIISTGTSTGYLADYATLFNCRDSTISQTSTNTQDRFWNLNFTGNTVCTCNTLSTRQLVAGTGSIVALNNCRIFNGTTGAQYGVIADIGSFVAINGGVIDLNSNCSRAALILDSTSTLTGWNNVQRRDP